MENIQTVSHNGLQHHSVVAFICTNSTAKPCVNPLPPQFGRHDNQRRHKTKKKREKPTASHQTKNIPFFYRPKFRNSFFFLFLKNTHHNDVFASLASQRRQCSRCLVNGKKIDWPYIVDKNRRFRLLNMRLESVWTHLFSIPWHFFHRTRELTESQYSSLRCCHCRCFRYTYWSS